MAYTLVWTRVAASDLEAIVRYVARDNPGAARALAERILGRLDEVARFPRAQRLVPEFAEHDLREAILNPYRIVYHVNETSCTITVLRIWHAARGVPEVGNS